MPKQSGKATLAKLLQNWARAEVVGAGLVSVGVVSSYAESRGEVQVLLTREGL